MTGPSKSEDAKRLEKAANAGDLDAAMMLADLVATTDVKRAVSTLRKARPKTPREELFLARRLVVYSEWAMRAQRGLSMLHIETMDDLGFPRATNEYARYKKASAAYPEKLADTILVYFHDGGTDRAVYQQSQGDILGTVDFDMPQVDAQADGADRRPVIWLGCDQKYHAFAEPFIRSIRSHGDFEIVLHTLPDHPLGAKFYHAARFIALAQWMTENDRPVWLMDVDALANRSPEELFSQLDGVDLATRGRPGRIEPWNQLNASVIGFNNTAAGKHYLKTVSAFIARAEQRNELEWGVDQVALLCCYRALKPRVALLGSNAVNYDYADKGIIWCNSGSKKWRHLEEGATDPEHQPFLDAFQKFKSPAA